MDADRAATRAAKSQLAVERALARPQPDPRELTRYVFLRADGAVQEQGGLRPEGVTRCRRSSTAAQPEATRINMLTAIRRTLDVELALNPRMLVFGEDVGPKGGVHGATLGLQDKYGVGARVRHQSLRGGHHRARGGHGARGSAAGGRDPVPQVRRAGRRAAQRLRHAALAHATTALPRRWWCACPAGSSSAAIPGTARPTRSPACTVSAGTSPCPRTREDAVGLLARGAARQRSGDLLRASRHARWRLGAPSLSG